METQEIVTVAQCFAGREFNEQELAVLADLCAEAAKQWREQLREGVEPEDCRGVFLTASAWTALAAMSQALEASQPLPLGSSASGAGRRVPPAPGAWQGRPGCCWSPICRTAPLPFWR